MMLITDAVTPIFGRDGPSLQQASIAHLKRDFKTPSTWV